MKDRRKAHELLFEPPFVSLNQYPGKVMWPERKSSWQGISDKCDYALFSIQTHSQNIFSFTIFNQSADSVASLHPPQLSSNFQLHALTILNHWECSPTVFFCREYLRNSCDKPTAQCWPRNMLSRKKKCIFSYSYCYQCQCCFFLQTPKFMLFTLTQKRKSGPLVLFFDVWLSIYQPAMKKRTSSCRGADDRNAAWEWLFLAHSTYRFKKNCHVIKAEKTLPNVVKKKKKSVFMINSFVNGHYAILLDLYQCRDCVNTEGNIIHLNQIKQAAVKLNQ